MFFLRYGEKKIFRDAVQSRDSTLVWGKEKQPCQREAKLIRVGRIFPLLPLLLTHPLSLSRKRETEKTRLDNIYAQRERYVRTKNYTHFLDNYKLIIATATITASTATTTTTTKKTSTTWTTTIAEAPTTTR